MNPNMAYNYDDDYRSELINGKIIMMSPGRYLIMLLWLVIFTEFLQIILKEKVALPLMMVLISI